LNEHLLHDRFWDCPCFEGKSEQPFKKGKLEEVFFFSVCYDDQDDNLPKLFFSGTLEKVEWHNTRLVKENIAEFKR